MLKNFLMRKMVESKMKDVPLEQREMILTMIEKNPELFGKIAKEIEQKIKEGGDQMSATMEVLQKYENELKGIVNPE